MTTSQQVYAYYTQHFNQLADDKRFHFASRLAAWNNDSFSLEYLKSVKSQYLPSEESVYAALENLIHNPPQAKINAAETRQPYFDKYPELRGRMLALFRVRHLLTIYGEDYRETLLQIIPKASLYELSERLQEDGEALRILSTYAINYIYLVEVILFPRERPLPLAYFLELGAQYNTEKPEDIQLLIYFYTHCIIGASNFYARHTPEHEAQQYHAMLTQLEALIRDRFDDINLDNKLEYLVCCRIVNFPTSLSNRVYEECAQSISPEGDFVIDTLNSFKQSQKTSFSDSEHRNVLFIMSTSNYSPLS